MHFGNYLVDGNNLNGVEAVHCWSYKCLFTRCDCYVERDINNSFDSYVYKEPNSTTFAFGIWRWVISKPIKGHGISTEKSRASQKAGTDDSGTKVCALVKRSGAFQGS